MTATYPSLLGDTATMRTVRRLAGLLETLIALLLAAVFALSLGMVILRYLFDSGFAGANELMRYLFVYTTAIGASLAVLRGEHIRITVLVDALPIALARWVDRLRHLLVMAFNGLMGWLSLDWIAQVGSARSAMLDIPNWAVQISIPISAVLVMLLSLAVTIGGERPATTRDDAEETQA